MSIKGLSDIRRCPRLGKLRLGEKASVEGRPDVKRPKETGYFLLDPQTGSVDRDFNLRSQFKELYGSTPTRILVMFPPVSREMFFTVWNKRYGISAMLKCKGDGMGTGEGLTGEAVCIRPEYAQGLTRRGKNEMGQVLVQCDGQNCIYQNPPSKECSRVGSLQVILPELTALGVFQLDTRSFNSIVNINSGLDWLDSMCGRCQMLPIHLLLTPQMIVHDGQKRKHFILQIDMNLSIMQLQERSKMQLSQVIGSLPLLTADPVDTVPRDVINIEEKKEDTKEPEESSTAVSGKKEEQVIIQSAPAWSLGNINRFREEKGAIQQAQKYLKEYYDRLGHDRFMRCVGDAGWDNVGQIFPLQKVQLLLIDLAKIAELFKDVTPPNKKER